MEKLPSHPRVYLEKYPAGGGTFDSLEFLRGRAMLKKADLYSQENKFLLTKFPEDVSGKQAFTAPPFLLKVSSQSGCT